MSSLLGVVRAAKEEWESQQQGARSRQQSDGEGESGGCASGFVEWVTSRDMDSHVGSLQSCSTAQRAEIASCLLELAKVVLVGRSFVTDEEADDACCVGGADTRERRAKFDEKVILCVCEITQAFLCMDLQRKSKSKKRKTKQTEEGGKPHATAGEKKTERIKPSKAHLTPLPDELQKLIFMLQGFIVDFVNGSKPALANSVSQLCETWWLQERPNRENVAPVTSLYLTACALNLQAKVADINRLYAFKEAFLVLDFQAESTGRLKNLLLKCFIHPPILNSQSGFKFLVFSMNMDAQLLTEMHQTMQAQMRTCWKSVIDIYGSIYFRAWKQASGACKIKLESCLQSLIETGMLVANPKVVKLIQQILSNFYKHKNEKAVDELLYRLYGPILWLNLSAANPKVRRNTAVFFFDAFPLQDPDASMSDTYDYLQRQFTQIKDLLKDPCDLVRSVAVHGTCSVLNTFWELIPPTTSQTLLQTLILELALDKSSALVRTAVFDGLQKVLDNFLTHDAMKVLLPKLKNSIHDTNKKVRRAFVGLLQYIKGMSDINFLDIVPLDHLLYRLSVDTEAVIIPLTRLLASIYLPDDKHTKSLLSRCFEMIKSNPRAAVVFYTNAPPFVMISTICKLMAALLLHLNSKGTIPITPATPVGDQTNTPLSSEAEELVILEVMTTLSQRVLPLCTDENKYLAEQLLQEHLFSVKSLFKVSDKFGELKHHATLHIRRIISLLPRDDKTAKKLLGTLKNFQCDVSESDYEPLIKCLFSWKDHTLVLEVIISFLGTLDKLPNAAPDFSNKSGSRPDLKASIGLKYFNCILADNELRTVAFEDIDSITGIAEKLHTHVALVQERANTTRFDEATDVCLLTSFTTFCKLIIHQFGSQALSQQDADLPNIVWMINWATHELIPKLNSRENSTTSSDSATNSSTTSITSTASSVLAPITVSNSNTSTPDTFIEEAILRVVILISEFSALGMLSLESCEPVLDLIRSLVCTDRASVLTSTLPLLSRLLHHWLRQGGDFTPHAITALLSIVTKVPFDSLQPGLNLSDVFSTLSVRGTLHKLSLPLLDSILFVQLDDYVPSMIKNTSLCSSMSKENSSGFEPVSDLTALPSASQFVFHAMMKVPKLLLDMFLQLKHIFQTQFSSASLWKILSIISILMANLPASSPNISTLEEFLLSIISKTEAGTDATDAILYDIANSMYLARHKV
ncbi:Condensin-2 complex subunit G2 [Pelomyxa schiedti]|nr:Condensin-2 complex subunit G2 [Pelomyxa schiedti]